MFYVKKITTPANTSRLNPKVTRIRAWGGVITKIAVRFPPGPQFLLHVTVSVGGHQIFPVNETDSVIGDDESVETQEYYEMTPGWNTITIKTWNEDTLYAHDCVVRITVLPKFIADPFHAIKDIALSMRMLLKRIGVIR